MKKILSATAIATCTLTATSQATTTIQEWNFTENGSGLANNVSEQFLNSGFFDSPDPVASDGGATVQRGDGFAGDKLLGITLNDANAKSVTFSVTLSSFDFTDGTTDTRFGVRLREDSTNTTIAELRLQKQDANDRVRLLGTAVAGVAVDAESSSASITYGMTLDYENDTYTYWMGTPTSDQTTWASRFNAHTGPLVGLGTTDADSVQFLISNHTSGNQFVIDQIQFSYVPVPEPSTTALLGLGGLALILRRKK